MKWLRTIVIFDQGNIVSSVDWKAIHESYVRSIQSIDHPNGSGALKLRRKMRLPNKQSKRNGVGYLRARFLDHMQNAEKWHSESDVNLARDRKQPTLRLYPTLEQFNEPITSDFGGFDFVTTGEKGLRVAIEWETGNISSSHRSMNKLSIALANKIVQIGVLIVPSRQLYDHLTDRIGNIGELSGYLSMWESLKSSVETGLLAVTVVEHDMLTDEDSFPFLPVGNDGRAQQARMSTEN